MALILTTNPFGLNFKENPLTNTATTVEKTQNYP